MHAKISVFLMREKTCEYNEYSTDWRDDSETLSIMLHV